MSNKNSINEVLYLVQHSTGIRPTKAQLLRVLYNPDTHGEVVDALIVIIHKDSQKYKSNPNLRSCDW